MRAVRPAKPPRPPARRARAPRLPPQPAGRLARSTPQLRSAHFHDAPPDQAVVLPDGDEERIVVALLGNFDAGLAWPNPFGHTRNHRDHQFLTWLCVTHHRTVVTCTQQDVDEY